MSTQRKKAVVIQNITSEAAEAAFADFARASSLFKKGNAELELKITKLREGVQDVLNANKEEMEKHFAILQTYALENEKLFDKKKTYSMTHGEIGFRTTTPALKPLKGFTLASVVKLVKEFLPSYVRTKEELDKESLIAKRDEPAVAVLFDKCGFEIKQEETFFVAPKEEQAA